MSATVAVDFDGVVHAYSRGWQDGTIYDDPVPGAGEGIRKLQLAGVAVFILTSRRDLKAVARWLVEHFTGFPVELDLPTDPVEDRPEFWNDTTAVLVTNQKLPAVAYLDDRALLFTTWDDALDSLLAGRRS